MSDKIEVPDNLSEAQAKAYINDRIKAAYSALAYAQAAADKYKLSFGFSTSYGMGGRYIGDPEERAEYYEWGEFEEDGDDGWRPSSRGC